MHMADGLISPVVGGVMWVASAGTIAWCSKKVRTEAKDSVVPLMGVLGAFIFAAQMINFTIPATGSSGHLGGGMILSILLGPYAAFLTIASVLTVQAFFFADGGLLALGCNIFNLGFFPAFIAYPLIYRKLLNNSSSQGRISLVAIISSVVALQMGAFAVVLETLTSGISSLPFATFVTLMQPIHLAIGIVEGVVTTSVIVFVYKARPDILDFNRQATGVSYSVRGVVMAFLAATLLTGGFVSWYASQQPDGLEWSIAKVTGKGEFAGANQGTGIHSTLASLQKQIAILPDYSFKKTDPQPAMAEKVQNPEPTPFESRLGTSTSGVVGGGLTLIIAATIGIVLRRRNPAS